MVESASVTGPWSVYRQDIHGGVYEMRWGLPEDRAIALAKEFNDKGHHQTYWHDLPQNRPDAVRMGVPDAP